MVVSKDNLTKTKYVGIYRKVFPRVSETFITKPAGKMLRYEPTFIACQQLKQTNYPTVSINHNDPLKIKQTLYLASRSPYLFRDKNALSKLNLIHSHFGPDGTYAMALAKKLKIPFLVTFHGWDITIDHSVPWKIKSPLYYQLLWHEAELQKSASVFIAVSKFIESKLLEKGYPRNKVVRHYIGIDTEKFVPNNVSVEGRYVLCVGRHTEKKGIDTLLRAFARIAAKHPDVSLLQVGTGKLEAKLKALAETLNISNQVKFLGALPYREVQRPMKQAEIFTLPSQTARDGNSEGLPFVILEAMASAVPVVSTWHSGIPEAVLDGETGSLVEEKDIHALADKLNWLLHNRQLSREMGYRGREIVRQKFDIQKQTLKLESIYDRVLARH